MKKLICGVMVFAGFLFYGCFFPEPVEPRTQDVFEQMPPRTPGTTIPTVPSLYYSQFGAKGDGITDDFEAIKRTHDAANIKGAKVVADPGAVYYIGPATNTIIVQTDTDWGDAGFIIDDSTIEKRGAEWAHSWVFRVESAQKPFPVYSISGLEKGQTRLPLNLGQRMMFIAVDETTRQYIRTGGNESAGDFQKDVFIVDEKGNVDMDAPIIWDFHNISSLTAYPIDEHQLKITGGRFTTIANRGTNIDPYMWRGIHITRSNVLVDGFYHDIVGGEELPVVAYLGILYVTNAADVTIQNTTLTGRVPMNNKGTYGLLVETSINLRVINCDQTNDHTNNAWWGIFASNYSKNIQFDNVTWSRFDAHRGVHNATLLNCDFGHGGVQIIGSGDLLVENTTVRSTNYINLRSDYGATWEGDIYITNARHILGSATGTIVNTQNPGTWNFGYQCFMPKFIWIDGYHADNDQASGSNVNIIHNTQINNTPENPPFPYILTDTIFIRGFRANTGRTWQWASNVLRDNITVVENW